MVIKTTDIGYFICVIFKLILVIAILSLIKKLSSGEWPQFHPDDKLTLV